MEHRADFRHASTAFLQMHKIWDRASKELSAVYDPKLLNFLANQPFLSKIFNAIAKHGHAKPKKDETTGIGTCKDNEISATGEWISLVYSRFACRCAISLSSIPFFVFSTQMKVIRRYSPFFQRR
jgi:hypothetical protein